jgi:RNA polymerase sigma-70 factor (ECF subfamily)
VARRNSHFSQTDWSMIGRLAGDDQAGASEALDRLLRRYWPAVYSYIRRSGRDVHEAADLTQSFVSDVLIRRGLLQGADRAKGRFRNLLLESLRNYLREAHRTHTRRKRAPKGGVVLGLDISRAAPEDGEQSPEGAFDAAWFRTMVQSVFQSVREQCLRDGLHVHWSVFEARIVQPALHGAKPIPFDSIAAALGLGGASHACNLLITVRRRFAKALRAEIASTLDDPARVDDELAELLALIDC